MKIKYITEDGILALKNNANIIYSEVIKKKSKTINEVLNDKSMIKLTPFDIDDFVLDMSQPKGKENLTDCENIQRVYNHMKHLSESQASDERLWVAFTLMYQIDYMRYRWSVSSSNDMLNKYFFNYSAQRSLFRNGISRLWWIGRLTYDENRKDPYELTKFLCRDQDYIESICSRNIFNNRKILKSTIDAILKAEKDGIKIDRAVIRDISKYLNLLSGIYLVDLLSYEEIYEKIYNKLSSIRGN